MPPSQKYAHFFIIFFCDFLIQRGICPQTGRNTSVYTILIPDTIYIFHIYICVYKFHFGIKFVYFLDENGMEFVASRWHYSGNGGVDNLHLFHFHFQFFTEKKKMSRKREGYSRELDRERWNECLVSCDC